MTDFMYVPSAQNPIYFLSFFYLLALCVLVFCGVALIFIRLLNRSNDFGDEDIQKLRKGSASVNDIGSELGSDMSVGSMFCIKHFQVNDVTKK